MAWLIIGVYIAIMFVISVLSVKKANSLTAFTVGGRSAGPWLSAFAYSTTYFSAVIFIGYAGRTGWDFGKYAVLIGLGNALIGTLLAWILLGNRTREVTRRHKIKTMPEMFKIRYQSRHMKLFAAVVIFVFLVPYSASVYSGLAYLSESVLGVDYFWCMIIIAVVTAAYLVAGGYLATLAADLVQGIIMLVGVVLMILFVTSNPSVGGITAGLAKTSQFIAADVAQGKAAGVWSLIALIILTSIGACGMPQVIHKFYGVVDKRAIRAGTIISTVFSFIVACGAYFVGSMGRAFFDNVLPVLNGKANFDMIVPLMLAGTLPKLLLGVIFVLVLSASVSTLSGIVLTASTAITMDLGGELSKKEENKGRTLLWTRLFCLIFVVLSLIIASFKSPILTLMAFSWGTIAGAFLFPYVLGLFWRGMTRAGAWAGMLGGFGAMLLQAVLSGFSTAKSPQFGVISMGVSLVLCVVVSLLTPKYDKQFVDGVMPQGNDEPLNTAVETPVAAAQI